MVERVTVAGLSFSVGPPEKHRANHVARDDAHNLPDGLSMDWHSKERLWEWE